MGAEGVLVSLLEQLAAAQPFQVQRDDSTQGLIDTSFLLVFDRLARRPYMSVDVQDGRNLALYRFGLVEDGGACKPRNDLVAQLANPVARAAGKRAHILESRSRLDPILGPAVKHHLVQDPLA